MRMQAAPGFLQPQELPDRSLARKGICRTAGRSIPHCAAERATLTGACKHIADTRCCCHLPRHHAHGSWQRQDHEGMRTSALLLLLLAAQPQPRSALPQPQYWEPRALQPFDAAGQGRELLQAEGSADLAQQSMEACMLGNLRSVVDGCSPLGPNSTGNGGAAPVYGIRDATIKLLRSCVLGSTPDPTNQTMRFLVPAGLSTLVDNLTDAYARTTGIELEMTNITGVAAFLTARTLSISNPTNRSITHEAWMVSPSAVGDGLASGGFMDISSLVVYDDKLQWQGLLPQVREIGLLYGSQVVALPFYSYTPLLYYRIDSFQRNNWTVPSTWRELADMAQRINGTDDMYGFSGWWGPCGLQASNLFRMIMASYHQSKGADQGWLIDPDTMRLMLDSPVMVEVADILRTLLNFSPPDPVLPGCPEVYPHHMLTYSHMGVFAPSVFKMWAHKDVAKLVGATPGTLGVQLLPGSERVLDRPTNTLVPCDKTRCPYATWVPRLSQWVNLSPGFDAVLLTLNKQAPSSLQFYAYTITSYLARPEVTAKMVFDPYQTVYPAREEHLDPKLWQSFGFNLDDATRLCTVYNDAFNHPNMHVQIRTPGATSMVFHFISLDAMLRNASLTPEAIARTFDANGQAILRSTIATTFRGNASAFRFEYLSSINRALANLPPPSAPNAGPPPGGSGGAGNVGGGAAGGDEGATNHTTLIVSLTVALTAGAAVVVGLFVYRSRLARRRDGTSALRKAPGVGPLTTLLVTDIQGSTIMWEELDAGVADHSTKLHNACIRTLAAKHKGYESVWEGDSFIVAFAEPQHALEFALAAQSALMSLDWPAPLLQHDVGREVWVHQQQEQQAQQEQQIPAGSLPAAGSATSRKGAGGGLRKVVPITSRSWVLSATTSNAAPAATSAGATGTQMATTAFAAGAGNARQNVATLPSFSTGPISQWSARGVQALVNSRGTEGAFEQQLPNIAFLLTAPSGTSLLLHEASDPASLLTSGEFSAPAPEPAVLATQPLAPPINSHHSAGEREIQTQRSADAVAVWTMGAKLRSKWQANGQKAGGDTDAKAVLVHRGLRVRIGFYAGGLDSAADMTFNKASRRYTYTGKLRIRSNTVAAAGMGGHILLTLGTLGLIRQLPDDCCVMHMGVHALDGWPEEQPQQLVMVLPNSLRHRVVLPDLALRTAGQLLGGFMDAPMPPPTHSPRGVRVFQGEGGVKPPVLLALQVPGVQALLAWNRHEAQVAIRHLTRTAWESLRHWSGSLSEDGLSPLCEERLIWPGATKHGALPEGCLVAAFATARGAVGFALQLRHQLLLLDWSEELLEHEMCEQVGIMPPHGATWPPADDDVVRFELCDSLEAAYGAGLGSSNRVTAQPSQYRNFSMGLAAVPLSNDTLSAMTSTMTSPLASRNAIMPPDALDVSNDADADVRGDAASVFEPKPSTITLPRVHFEPEPRPSRPISPTVTKPRSTLVLVTTWPSVLHSGTTSAPALARASSIGHAASTSRLTDLALALLPRPSTSEGLSVGNHVTPHRKDTGDVSARGRSMMGAGTACGTRAVFASRAPMLCGPRIKVVVAAGRCKGSWDRLGCGRVVYGGRAVRQLGRLLQGARQGEVLVSGAAMQAMQHEDPARVALTTGGSAAGVGCAQD